MLSNRQKKLILAHKIAEQKRLLSDLEFMAKLKFTSKSIISINSKPRASHNVLNYNKGDYYYSGLACAFKRK